MTFILVLARPSVVRALPAGFVEDPVAGGWSEAVGLTFAENGRMFVWERGGRVWIVENGSRLATPLVDIREEVGAWRDHGLLGFALDPAYLVNGHVYLLYAVDRHHLLNFGTGSYNPGTTITHEASIGRVVRYTAREADGFRTVDPTTRVTLIGETIGTGIPLLHESHGVGTLLFAADNTLLVSTGDGASFTGVDTGSGVAGDYSGQALADGIIGADEDIGAFRSQYLESMNGKILRIDPTTGDGVPSNLFYDTGASRSARSRTYALGMRNPFRMAIRDDTGSHVAEDGDPGVLYIGDVGWNNWEELHVVTAPGQNAGWPVFEGMELNPISDYLTADVRNQAAVNPLGCETFFQFMDLITQDTLDPTPFLPNPCDGGQSIPGSVETFVHSRPVLDWSHGGGITRVGIFDGLDADTIRIGELDSPVSGPEFSGRSSTGGVWYSGHAYPDEYHDVYYLADYDGQWMRLMRFDSENRPVEIEDFSGGHRYVALAVNPLDECLYFVSWNTGVWKISYEPGGNRPPAAIASADRTFGTGPLSVQFQGADSTDPEGGALTYLWDFDDNTADSTLPNPMHTFSAPVGVPTRYDVTLTVRDTINNESQASLIISVNNTPPRVTITSPVDGDRYPLDQGNLTYDFEATVEDDEHSGNDLECAWENILHHNDHTHQDPPDPNCSTSGTISPVGCDGQRYFYRMVLTVTDAAGLSTSDEVVLIPDCPNVAPTAVNDEAELGRGQTIDIAVLTNDFDTVGFLDPTTVEIKDEPNAGSAIVDLVTGVIAYTHNGSGVGTDLMHYTVRDDDGALSNEAEVEITIDVEAPTLVAASSTSLNHVTVQFSEALSAASATDASNYSIDGGIEVFTANVSGPKTVVLTTSAIVSGTSLTVTVNNVSDLAGNIIPLDSSITIEVPLPGPTAEDRSFWLAADNGAHTHEGGSEVTEWHDVSGSPVMHDGTAIGEPQLTTTLFPNGQTLPVVRFDGDDGFVHDNPGDLELSHVSVYAVIRPDVTGPSQCILANYQNVVGLGFGISDRIAGRIKWFTAQPVNSMEVSGADLADDTPVLLTAIYDDGEKRLYVDGELVGSESGLDIEYGNTMLTVGNLLGGSQFFTGDIAELIVYASVSAEQQEQVEGYLNDKYFEMVSVGPRFRRGDSDGDGLLTIADPLTNLFFQFLGNPVPCRDALDFDDSGSLSIQDPIGNLIHQFSSGPPPAPPGVVCGEDPSADSGGDLGCGMDC